eukprot:TRINITY_DN439_c0_g1_i1.p1 TRINITY_DN439_c0_g1~~TRINITY_DN439_c0_g1_i1.p1  ORF type:complete len:184 (+),score=74.56 TRINITY_DN439_c0_g1_i1:69-620(+)
MAEDNKQSQQPSSNINIDPIQPKKEFKYDFVLTSRFARKDDFEFIYGLLREILEAEEQENIDFREQIELIEKVLEKEKVLIAEVEGVGLVGFIWFEESDRTPFGFDYGSWDQRFLWICNSGTIKSWRRKGIATFLYKQVEQIAKQRNIHQILLDVYLSNKPSLSFHTSFGYQPFAQIFSKTLQ